MLITIILLTDIWLGLKEPLLEKFGLPFLSKECFEISAPKWKPHWLGKVQKYKHAHRCEAQTYTNKPNFTYNYI